MWLVVAFTEVALEAGRPYHVMRLWTALAAPSVMTHLMAASGDVPPGWPEIGGFTGEGIRRSLMGRWVWPARSDDGCCYWAPGILEYQ